MASREATNRDKPKASDWWARGIAFLALGVSATGLWLNYASSLPVISARIQLAEPITAGQPIKSVVSLENLGRTTAHGMRPNLRWAVSNPDVPFRANYKDPPNWSPDTFDLAPGGHRTLRSTEDSTVNLPRQEDVDAVSSRKVKLYVYGKIPYEDGLGFEHEFHFCGEYRKVAGVDPLDFIYCSSYNGTD